MLKHAVAVLLATGTAGLAGAEVVASSSDHYTLRHEANSTMTPGALWERLIQPDTWWHPNHTWSADAANLSLDAQAGGLWREDWDGGSVAHGTVLAVTEDKMLRLDAPFGPLQGMGVQVVWTITLTPDEESGGTLVVFDEVANGSSATALDQIAPAVDSVKQQAIERLVAPAE